MTIDDDRFTGTAWFREAFGMSGSPVAIPDLGIHRTRLCHLRQLKSQVREMAGVSTEVHGAKRCLDYCSAFGASEILQCSRSNTTESDSPAGIRLPYTGLRVLFAAYLFLLGLLGAAAAQESQLGRTTEQFEFPHSEICRRLSDEQLAQALKAAEENQRDARARRRLIDHYYGTKNLQHFLSHAEALVRHAPDSREALSFGMMARAGCFPSSEHGRFINIWLEQEEKHPQSEILKKSLLAFIGDARPELTEAVYARALRLPSADLEMRVDYGIFCWRRGRPGEAIVYLEKVPRSPRVRWTLALAYRDLREFELAREEAQKLIDESYAPDSSTADGRWDRDAHYLLGGIALSQGRTEEAISQANRAIEIVREARSESQKPLDAVGRYNYWFFEQLAQARGVSFALEAVEVAQSVSPEEDLSMLREKLRRLASNSR